MRPLAAFTIVELLVVITILVVLLALLMPALDRAIYQADLTVCAAKTRAAANGALQYAFDHSKRFPYRQTIDDGDHIRPDYLAVNAVGSAGAVSFDDRPTIRNYIPLNPTLNCPLTPAVDLEVQEPSAQTFVYTSYALWFGFRFGRTTNPEPGMRKLGDRFAWQGSGFDLLASDSDSIDIDKWVGTAHPDAGGQLNSEVLRNELNDGYFVTFSFWTNRNRGQVTRDGVDLNFAHTDGSVRRMLNVLVDDTRLVPVPDRSSTTGWASTGPGRRRWLPPAE